MCMTTIALLCFLLSYTHTQCKMVVLIICFCFSFDSYRVYSKAIGGSESSQSAAVQPLCDV